MTPQEAWVQFCLTLPREKYPCIKVIRETIGIGLRDARDLYLYGVSFVHDQHPIAPEVLVQEKVHGSNVAVVLSE
jgi:hypothetical protein